jgi:hypothetical protein
MTNEEINTLVVNIICYVCGIDEDHVYVGWQSKSWKPNYGSKIFYINCDNEKEAKRVAKLFDGEIEVWARGLDMYYADVIFPLRNVFR